MKTLTIEVDEASAQIVADMLLYYNLANLEEAERRDQFKDNSPYKNAIHNFLKAFDQAKKNS